MNQIQSETILTPAGDITIPGFYSRPAGPGPLASVIVLHGSDGFKPNHAAIAGKLAAAGLAAYAPTWFAPGTARPHWDSLRPEDITTAVADFQSRLDIDPGRTGLMGFSRGGGLALFFGTLLPGVQAIVNYFGLTDWTGGLAELPRLPLNHEEPLDFIRRLPCPVLSFHGDQDTVVPASNTRNLDQACRRYGVPHRAVIYPGVDHSFIWEGGDKYDKSAHHDSWRQAVAFLKHQLTL